MRRIPAILAAITMGLAGCAQSESLPMGTTIEPKSGPAATAGAKTSTVPSPSKSIERATPVEPSDVASFQEQRVFSDGVRVEVTKILHARLTKVDLDSQEMKAKVGDHYVDFTVRMSNATKESLSITTNDSVTYGPDGEQAEEIYLGAAVGDITGSVLSGKSRSVHLSYLIPTHYQDDVLLEFSFNEKYGTAIFAGSVK
jgi:hypothetical protein